MMEKANKRNILNEIEKSRVSSLYLRQSSRTGTEYQGKVIETFTRANTYCEHKPRTQPSDVSDGECDLDIKSTALNCRSRSVSCSTDLGTEERQLQVEKNLNHGMLYKTSRVKITSELTRGQHEHRQYRRFQLTEHSLEYSHELFQKVSIKTT